MRDLARHPITIEEAISAVEQEVEEYRKLAEDMNPEQLKVGDLHLLALEEAARHLRQLKCAKDSFKVAVRM